MKRVGIISLLHESNTFINQPTNIAHFHSNLMAEGPAVLDAYRGTQHEVGGFIDALAQEPDIETVGIFAARAMPYGTITTECWQELMNCLDRTLSAAGKLDGLLVAPHGATVSQEAPDADGFWLSRVRAALGPKIPIIGTLDLHANVSAEMVAACDALFGYRTNPHLDQRARGLEAGRMMVRTLRGEITPVQQLVQLPLCVNIERQATGEPQGVELWQEADRMARETPDVLSVSCLYGFPYSDVQEMGGSVIAVCNRDTDLAQQTAQQMARFWWKNRQQFVGQMLSVENAIELALRERQLHPDKPVGLLEMGDNVGGGSPGDGTWIVHGWLERGKGPILAVLYDPATVQAAMAAGVGNQLSVSVGGKTDPLGHGPKIIDNFRVRAITDGRFQESETRHGGYSRFNQGLTAVLEGESGVTVIATSLRVAPVSLQQVLAQGVRPENFAAIAIKGVHAPVAAYAPICSKLIRVNTPGVTTADVHQLEFHHRRHPMEPFERAEL